MVLSPTKHIQVEEHFTNKHMYIAIRERDAVNTIHTLWLHIEHLLDKIVLPHENTNREKQNRKETGRAGKGTGLL